MKKIQFEWDLQKDIINSIKHGISFSEAQLAFADHKRIVAEDVTHSKREKRYFCFGMVEDDIITVRFTYRNEIIRIFGAGYWRKGKAIYEKKNKIHKRAN
ncbi:MAG: BrnT family toxin [bacterium]|nr:BrnT family toxin [bacterium]